MNREILFRGKRLYNNKWMYGSLLCYEDGDHHICCDNFGLNHYRVDPETVGQFTGLTDKNGKKIFEGDIVHCISIWDEANLVVIFDDGEFRMVLSEQYKEYKPGCGFYAVRNFNKEVIGNIHDNPELLEGGVKNDC